MANKLIYPFINPVQIFSTDPDFDSRYNSKDFEDFDFPETILPFEQQMNYCQPWQLNDTMALQLQSNIGPVNWVLKRCSDDSVVDTLQFDQLQESVNEPGLFLYELSAPLSGYEEGCYYVELQFGVPLVFSLRSGEQNFATLQEGSILAQYKNYENREDIIFETGFFPTVRFLATKRYVGPKQKATVYEDQVLNMSALRAIKYRIWNLVIGGTFGIPDYFADMIGGIIGCSTLTLDGKYYTVNEGKELEPNGIDYYPMRGWSIELRERYNRAARIYENDDPIDAAVTVMVNVDSKGFGNSNSGSQTAVIEVI